MIGLLELEPELFPLVNEEMEAPRLCDVGIDGTLPEVADPRRRKELAALDSARSDMRDSDWMRCLTEGRRNGRRAGLDLGGFRDVHSAVALISPSFSSTDPLLMVGEEGLARLERSMGDIGSSIAPAVEPHKSASMPEPRGRFRRGRAVACVRVGEGQVLVLARG